ncbi:ABC transporter permease [Spiroplasma cantharicola]|uniref:Ribose/galactose ABC transporter permease n=1 Tax=Spiroplasma cantharicola TaxID=362837 RepID=A0A0M4JRJ2_9MOLU|nr:ABC transporter permease [Spiroplasma cantharicola]ALD65997.1 ribose/galactose ABC transporter permease [Spiroplasma cantharicola]
MFKVKLWTLKVKTEAFVKSPGFLEKLGFVKSSVISIVLGLLVGVLFIFSNGENGFAFLGTAFVRALSTNVDRTLVYFGVYILIGLGLALGFKLKIFNMGGSGQILSGLLMSYLIMSSIGNDTKNAFLIFIMFIISGMLISVLCGAMKVYLNVHEVASSILLNWIFWYLLKWYMTVSGTPAASPSLNESMAMLGNSLWALCVMLALISVVVVYIIFTFTTTGYKVKVIGNSPTAAKYAGIKSQYYILMVMAIQGALISMAGFFYYFLIQGSVTFNKDLVPQLGFDGIPIALVAFNNILGIVPIAFFWAIVKEGAAVAITTPNFNNLQPEVADLIFGIIIYCSTLYVIFIKLNLWTKIKEKLYLEKDIITKNQIGVYKLEIKSIKKLIKEIPHLEDLVAIKEEIKKTSRNDKQKIKDLSYQYNELKTFHHRKHLKNIEAIKQLIHDAIENGYRNYRLNSINGLWINFNNQKIGKQFVALDIIIEKISDYDKNEKSIISQECKELIENTKKEISVLKESYLASKLEAKNFLKDLKNEYKKNLKENQDTEKIKKEYFERLVEVKDKYDRLH